jgi:hypothetical protein
MFNVLEKSVVDSVDLVFDPTESCCVLTVLFVVLAVQTHDESHDWSATTDEGDDDRNPVLHPVTALVLSRYVFDSRTRSSTIAATPATTAAFQTGQPPRMEEAGRIAPAL